MDQAARTASTEHGVSGVGKWTGCALVNRTSPSCMQRRATAMRLALLATATLPLLASSAHARPVDWQAELDRCHALRQNISPLLRAGIGQSAIARSGAALRRCVWIERRAAKHGAR